ncbi:DUF4886 domain-containing protein [Aestuariibaculum suncheonense]|uniref:DUF4886 domain-containing protein n=1 Tax=Aestuariibaculum suncheonense TaxID=1028745 RepID=A0A8J6UBF3_9FLAO|nr:DUF4886 domain-containing protein [Aestuariibaculum suncheonense]MBD0835412.1 DUF4886 domain-containing protein [Aestuariibaculum suncheonense]
MTGTANVSLASTDGIQVSVYTITVKDMPAEFVEDGIIRILAIGNSFSSDGVESYLYELAKEEGIPIVIGNLIIGASSLDMHWQNASGNIPAYEYWKRDQNGSISRTPETSIEAGLADEQWDYISFQQVSRNSGQYETYVTPLPLLLNYVKSKATHPYVKYIQHQTWAYAQNTTHEGFANYNNDQITMYNAIVDATGRAKNLVGLDILIPVGTAIQNGRTSVIGDKYTRDGYHLDVNIGRYTAACTWFEAISGKSVIGNTYKPFTLSEYHAEIAQNAAHNATLKPSEITEMVDYKGDGPDALTDEVFISFGSETVTSGWNGFMGSSSYTKGKFILNLKDKNDVFTGASIEIVEGFNSRNDTGEKGTITDFNMSDDLSSYSYFGNSKLDFSEKLIEKSVLKLSGLDNSKTYDLCFFGSKSSAVLGENGETKYTSKGKNEIAVLLDAANNKSNTVCANGIQPDDNGDILITINAGENNNNVYGFYCINAMRITLSN